MWQLESDASFNRPYAVSVEQPFRAELPAREGVSRDGFSYLLDELNAYSHELNTYVALTREGTTLTRGDTDYERGVLDMMAFVKVYIEKADPKTFNYLSANCKSTPASALETGGYRVRRFLRNLRNEQRE